MDTDSKHPVDSVDVVMPTETAPLLGGDAKADARSWKGPWWQILGDGSAPDVAAFCLSWNVPALAFGWNAGRGLSKRWWLEALKYSLLSVGLMLLGHFIMMVVTTTACGPKHPMPHRHPHPAMMMRDSFHADVLPVEPMYMYAEDDEGVRELMEVMGEDQGTQTVTPAPADLPGATPLTGTGYYSYVENYYGEYQPLEPHLDLPAVDMSLVDVPAVDLAQRDHDHDHDHDSDHDDDHDHDHDSDHDDDHDHDHDHDSDDDEDKEDDKSDEHHSKHHKGDDEHGAEPQDYASMAMVQGAKPHSHKDCDEAELGDALLMWLTVRPRGPGGWDAPLPPTPEEVEQCMDAVAPAALSVSIMMVLGLVVLITYAARRRTMMRERFGIPGSSRADCCLWTWCAPCALAQETRTMMHNNVEEGLWLGPHQVVYTAPAQQEV
ncbi:hypothetical protein QJQ45_030187 [Haematococcus lacustris]|nr:hypothetical protein QJQ45_030187 [Haematococcus lacustris]